MQQVRIKISLTEPGKLPYVTLYHMKDSYRFLVDTGSSSSWLEPECIGKFLMDGETGNARHWQDDTPMFPATLRLAPVTGTQEDYTASKMRAVFLCKHLENLEEMNNYIKEPLHGILGADFLRQNSITVDMNNLELVA